MENQDIIQKINTIDEDLGFLEEVSKRELVEDRIEELRVLRHELERKLNYDKGPTFKDDPSNRKQNQS
tara:strand:+ start:76 stop:279 length:204 start_codon:yes stop_codon:yes gene_type:complete